jgi:hypothetical protein
MMYDTMDRPPRQGSLLELLFTMVQMRREAAKLMEVRAVIQTMRDQSEDGEPSQSAYDDFRRALMPYLSHEEKERSAAVRAAMNREFSMGPMAVTPIEPTGKVRSRLRRIVRQINEAQQPTLGWKRRRRGW